MVSEKRSENYVHCGRLKKYVKHEMVYVFRHLYLILE